MPRVQIVYYKEKDGTVPMFDWLDKLNAKAQIKCQIQIVRLQEEGHQLRRPTADYLRDGIYELRIGFQGLNYRLLYFFHGREAAIVSHGIVKERIVPPKEIDLAIKRKKEYEDSPEEHAQPMEY
jgi:phage-related protein